MTTVIDENEVSDILDNILSTLEDIRGCIEDIDADEIDEYCDIIECYIDDVDTLIDETEIDDILYDVDEYIESFKIDEHGIKEIHFDFDGLLGDHGL